jgi:dipeptidase E
MKLLLTSAGITNKSIESALQELVGKPFAQTKLVFVPTAANAEEGDKGWLIDDMYRCKQLGLEEVDIVDIAAVPKEVWLPRFEAADVLLFGGGNTYYLIAWMQKSGLFLEIPRLLETRVYVGISAGSMAASKELLVSQSKLFLFDEEHSHTKSNTGLGLVDFQFRPHLNSPYFTKIRKEYVEQVAKELNKPLYAVDDQTALKVVNGKVEIVTEGEYLTFNLSL